MTTPQTVVLDAAIDLDGFRRACRRLWSEQAAPETVEWHCRDDAEGDLFAGTDDTDDPKLDGVGDAPADATKATGAASAKDAVPASPASASASASASPPVQVPAHFMALCRDVVLHRDPGRFGLLYRLLWRLQREPGLRHDALDADWVKSQQMAQAVRRDMHKMKAFVRFRTVAEDAREGPTTTVRPEEAEAEAQTRAMNASGGAADDTVGDTAGDTAGAGHALHEDGDDDSAPLATSGSDAAASGPLHVAWFEPEHHVVEATAPFFARRFTAMRWAILTPERSVRWDGAQLVFGPGARREQAPPADAGEQLWLTYYESIFNPARLKVAMMKREMPVRYWHNLPEARLIGGLTARASERSMNMIERGPSEPAKRLPAAALRPQPTPGHGETPGDDAPATLPALREALDRCRECPIGEHATQAVPGEGLKHARLLFVGEQPGDQEDLQGRPFVGPAGQLFNRALVELGIERRDAYVTNAVKHFKFELRGKRRIHKTPAQQEAAACLHWLESEIGLVDPEALVALGATAARQLMGTAIAVTKQRGQWLTRADGRRVLVTLHPSALLRMEPADKEAAYAAWLADLRLAADFLRADAPPRKRL